MRLAIGDLSTWWVYLIGPVVGATIAVGAYVLRGPPKAQEAAAAPADAIEASRLSDHVPIIGRMTLERMDHVGVVVDDLASAVAFFAELGLELEGEATVEGRFVDRVIGLDGARSDIAMMRTPDGHSRLELTKFHTPPARGGGSGAPANALGIRHVTFAVQGIDDVLARLQGHGADSSASLWRTRTATGSVTSGDPRGSSSSWPRRSADRLDTSLADA